MICLNLFSDGQGINRRMSKWTKCQNLLLTGRKRVEGWEERLRSGEAAPPPIAANQCCRRRSLQINSGKVDQFRGGRRQRRRRDGKRWGFFSVDFYCKNVYLFDGFDACTSRRDLWMTNTSCRQIFVNSMEKSGQIRKKMICFLRASADQRSLFFLIFIFFIILWFCLIVRFLLMN